MPNNWYHTPRYKETWVPKSRKTKVIESVKRIAYPGEKIVITNKHYASDFGIGEVFTVTKVGQGSVDVKEHEQGVFHSEYEVITKSEEV